MKTRLACLLVAFATLVAPDLAHACGTGAVQFADDFKSPDPGWDPGDQVKIGSGVITLLPPVNSYVTTYNPTYIFGDADVCVQIKVSDFAKPEEVNGGLAFWVTDTSGYFTFQIYMNGSWMFWRKAGTRWINMSSGHSDAIKKGVGDLNEVEVRLSGNSCTGYVNGTKVATFNGQPPEGGGSFGVIGSSQKERTNTWEVRDFKILKLQ